MHAVQQHQGSPDTVQRYPDPWQIDSGKYYKLKASAEQRALELRQKYATVEVFQREDGNWQCRYKGTATKEQARESKESAPVTLALFGKDVGSFSEAELNDALYTVFGEISARLHSQLAAEAHAVASTIFNRKADIDRSRTAFANADAALSQAKIAYNQAIARYEDLANHPTKYKKQMGPSKYEKTLASAKITYNKAKKTYADAQRTATSANSDKIAAESYITASYRENPTITLTMIVGQTSQYEGYPKGKQDHASYSSMSSSDQARNAERWDVAKKVLTALAKSSGPADSYRQFRSNRQGKRTLQKGETRIGGNDFW
jgi:hypothetical protein